MKSDLAIAALIRSRMTELGLSRGELVKRLGYKNIAKGIRRIEALGEGDIEGMKQFLDLLPQALVTSAETVKRALHQTVRELELAPSPTCPSRARWSPRKAGCGRSGNKTGSQPRVSPPRRGPRTDGLIQNCDWLPLIEPDCLVRRIIDHKPNSGQKFSRQSLSRASAFCFSLIKAKVIRRNAFCLHLNRHKEQPHYWTLCAGSDVNAS
jgi:hypothetical protein